MFWRSLLKVAVLSLALVVVPSVAFAKSKTIKTSTGLQYQDLKLGKGPAAQKGQTVTIFYTGRLTDGRVFGTNKPNNQPLTFPLGGHQVMPGWDEGVQGMKVGGARKLTIPPELGYGARGAGGVIPPNATLVFEVELLKIL